MVLIGFQRPEGSEVYYFDNFDVEIPPLFTQSDTWKMSVIICTISFIISMVLNELINYVCQNYSRRY